MGKHCKRLLLQLDEELAAWLEAKAADGYKKASLVRAILHREMDGETVGSGSDDTEPAKHKEEGDGYDLGGEEDED